MCVVFFVFAGEVELCSDIDEVVRKVRDVVARQQKNCKWEILDY